MQVEAKKIRSWKKMADHGDIKKLAAFTGMSYGTLKRAFEGTANQNLIIMIDRFFEEKLTSISK